MKINLSFLQSAPTWCVADTGAPPRQLQKFLDVGCSGRFDCSPIKPGGPCYEPNTLLGHASWVINKYYQELGFCEKGIGFITTTNPCKSLRLSLYLSLCLFCSILTLYLYMYVWCSIWKMPVSMRSSMRSSEEYEKIIVILITSMIFHKITVGENFLLVSLKKKTWIL